MTGYIGQGPKPIRMISHPCEVDAEQPESTITFSCNGCTEKDAEIAELKKQLAKYGKDVRVLDNALGQVCGALWLRDHQGSSWTYIYDKYVKYAEREIDEEDAHKTGE